MEPFEANLMGITERQNKFLKEADYFVYFRKGEFENIEPVLKFFLDLLKAHPELVIFGSWSAFVTLVVKLYPQLKEIAKDTWGLFHKLKAVRKRKKELVIRIISSETKKNMEGLKKLEKKGVGVCRIPGEKRGRLRYLVNEKEFCLFVRHKENDFFGVEGTEKLMISRLRQQFETEYDECLKYRKEIISEY